MDKRIGATLALTLMLAAGCGNKGALYLPEDASKAEKPEQVSEPAPQPAPAADS
ncbi:lipoprotein [Corallincola platygyrae]|uniref:Lipoprotein n=2 Tax=Corallincola platygyrae TaxID=1193278 RepID=A0ABW4XKI3_9GAMM